MFSNLRQRLLLSYLAAIALILGTFTGAVYLFFARSLYQQVDSELLTLAQAASPSLAIAKREIPRTLNQDVSWHNLLRSEQSVEWLSIYHRLLDRVGTNFPTSDLTPNLASPQQQGQLRTMTISVYGTVKEGKQLEGYVRASTSVIPVEHTLNQLRWGIGLGLFLALILTGIGGMYLTEKAMHPIEQSFRRLKQFTADASHELRSPLTAIKISIEDIFLTHPESLDSKKLNRIAVATDQMTCLIDDLLLLTRMDGLIALPVQQHSISLNELLQDLMELLESQFQAKEIIFKSNLLNVCITGDSSQLLRLFTNLLENALYYTDNRGRITLTMELIDGSVLVNVEDTGIGIASEHLPYVFERFWRTDKARSRRKGGLGLGLAIAQAIAKSHGGKIAVSSQVGKGSCFQVSLPIA